SRANIKGASSGTGTRDGCRPGARTSTVRRRKRLSHESVRATTEAEAVEALARLDDAAPRDAALEDKEDAGERGAIWDARSPTFGLGPLRRHEGHATRPQLITDQWLAYVCNLAHEVRMLLRAARVARLCPRRRRRLATPATPCAADTPCTFSWMRPRQ